MSAFTPSGQPTSPEQTSRPNGLCGADIAPFPFGASLNQPRHVHHGRDGQNTGPFPCNFAIRNGPSTMELDSVPGATASMGEPRNAVRSCSTCSKAKAKCVRRAGINACERCFRLKKECAMKEPILRTRRTVKTTRSAQLEKLENKIEHLVNALSAQQALHSQPSPTTSSSDNGCNSRVASTHDVLESMCAHMGEEEKAQETSSLVSTARSMTRDMPSGSFNSKSLPSSADFEGSHALGVSMEEADILLDRWQRLMAPSLPFVKVPREMTARELYDTKPSLLHAIVTVTYFHSLPKQRQMVRTFMRDASERILINNEKNVGVVQAILVFVAWYHPHVFWGQQVTNLLHLAIAMTLDLGIDRSPASCASDIKAATAKAVDGPGFVQRVATLEEHRALAGVFYLASMLGTSFKKIGAIAYSKDLDDCLNTLAAAKEYESDLLLVQLTRLQHLAEDTSAIQANERPSGPVSIYVKAFNSDLDRLRRDDPCRSMPENPLLKMQYLTVEILIWELSLTAIQENKISNLRAHMADLYQLIEAIKAFADITFTLPKNSYLTLTFSVFGQFAHAFIVLTRLASLDTDDWDLAGSGTLDFIAMVEEAAMRFEAAKTSSPDGLRVNNDNFDKWAHRLRWLKNVYGFKFNKPSEVSSVPPLGPNGAFCAPPVGYGQATMPGPQQPTPPDEISSSDFFNVLDDEFWNTFGVGHNLGFLDIDMSNIG